MIIADARWKSDALTEPCLCVCVWCFTDRWLVLDQTPGLCLLNDRWWSHFRAHLEGGREERHRFPIKALPLSQFLMYQCKMQDAMIWSQEVASCLGSVLWSLVELNPGALTPLVWFIWVEYRNRNFMQIFYNYYYYWHVLVKGELVLYLYINRFVMGQNWNKSC